MYEDVPVPAVVKLLEVVASGIGATAGPIFLPWRAWWQGTADRIAARTDADVRRIEADTDANVLQIISTAQSEARQMLIAPDATVRGSLEINREEILQRLEYQERKRHANIRSVIEEAAYALGDKEVTDHEPDHDWTARFFDCVQDVSSEDMQKLWAKVLAGEVERPGGTSLRTLDTLRNMTKMDAVLFNDVCSFVLGSGAYFVFRERPYIADYEALAHTNLLHLQDCGLLQFGQSTHNITDQVQQVVYQSFLLQISRETETPRRISFNIATLTMAGAELYLVSEPQLHMDYLTSFSRFLQAKNCRLESAPIVKKYPDGRTGYRNVFTPVTPIPSDANP